MTRSFKFIFLIALMASIQAYAQVPKGINYQGVARLATGTPIADKTISIRISVLQNSANGTSEYAETHQPATNEFGLFTLVIGQGTVVTGDFDFISWANGSKWLQIEMDPEGGSNYSLIGSQQLMSVPYSYYAQYSGSTLKAGQGLAIENNIITNTGDGDNNAANELNTNMILGSDKVLRITDAGGTKQADLSVLVGTVQNLSQVLTQGNDAGAQKITNLATPINGTDAATKLYVDAHDDADANSTNEIQDLSLTGNSLKVTNNATASTINLAPYLDNTDNQNLTLTTPVTGTSRTVNISNGTSATFDVADNDNSSTNEIQSLTKTGSTIALSAGGGSVVLGDDNSTNEIQDLSRTGNTLSLTGDATLVDLGLYLDNTDAQTLATQLVDANTRSISITGGNITNVDVRDADASITNEIQDLSLTLNTLSLSSDATTVNLAPYLDNTDNQDLSIVGNSLSLTNDASPVNLAPYLDNTDSQNLSSTISGTNRTINISGGTGTTIDIADNDNSTTNEIQDLLLSTNTLSLSGDVTTVNLAPYLDNTDSQNLSSVAAGTNRQINISGGTGTTIDVADNDNNTTNEIQDLSINSATNILSLTSDATTVNLTPYLDNTDSQNLSSVVAGTNRQINISGGTSTTIDVADNDNSVTNEIQNLTYGPATNNLSISGGNNVTITTNLNQVLTTGAVAGGQRIQNIGTPTANADATTKQYVDDAIATAVAATFSFKVPYAFSSSGSPVTNQIVSFGAETYDDFNVLAANRFTVPSNGAGFYNIYIDGTSTNSPVTLKMRLNGTTIFTVKRQTSFPSALVINDFQIMLVKLAVGDFIELLVDSPNSGDQITGLFFGSKL